MINGGLEMVNYVWYERLNGEVPLTTKSRWKDISCHLITLLTLKFDKFGQKFPITESQLEEDTSLQIILDLVVVS